MFFEFLRFMESMRQQPKVSSVDQQYLNEKDTATAIGTFFLLSMLASSTD
jgi:hypothetical protein